MSPLRTTYQQGDHDPAGALNTTNTLVNALATLLGGNSTVASFAGSDAWLMAVTNAGEFAFTSVTYGITGAIATANVIWPDGSTGVFTTTLASSDFPGAIDAFTVTYVSSSGDLTVTQPAVTRDSSGRVTVQPELVIS